MYKKMLLEIAQVAYSAKSTTTMTVPYTSNFGFMGAFMNVINKHPLLIIAEDKNGIKKQMVAMVERVTVDDTSVKVKFSNEELKVTGKTAKDVVKGFTSGTYKNVKVVQMVGHDTKSYIWPLLQSQSHMTLTKSTKKGLATVEMNLDEEKVKGVRVLTYNSKTQRVESMSQQTYLNYAKNNLSTMPLTFNVVGFHTKKYTLQGKAIKLIQDNESNSLKVELRVHKSEWAKLPDQATIKEVIITHQEEFEFESFNHIINDAVPAWGCSTEDSGRCWGWGQLNGGQQADTFFSPHFRFTDRNGGMHRVCASTGCWRCNSHC
jgi:hypothetical protein